MVRALKIFLFYFSGLQDSRLSHWSLLSAQTTSCVSHPVALCVWSAGDPTRTFVVRQLSFITRHCGYQGDLHLSCTARRVSSLHLHTHMCVHRAMTTQTPSRPAAVLISRVRKFPEARQSSHSPRPPLTL